jgi:hypothetical protein
MQISERGIPKLWKYCNNISNEWENNSCFIRQYKKTCINDCRSYYLKLNILKSKNKANEYNSTPAVMMLVNNMKGVLTYEAES